MNERNGGEVTSALRDVLRWMTTSNQSFYYDWMPFAKKDSLAQFFTQYQREQHFVFVYFNGSNHTLASLRNVHSSHLTSFVDDVSDVLIALLNQVLEEADGLSTHKIGITDKSPSGDNIDIHLAIVNKPKRTQDNTQKKSLQNLLNEMFFDCASPVLIIQFQRTTHDENNKRTKVTYDAVQFEEKIQINCEGQRAEYSLLGFVRFKSNHYTVTCLNIPNSVWHTYDDHLISKNDKNTIRRLRKSDQVTTLIYTNYDSNQPAISTIPSTAEQEKSMDQNTGRGNNVDNANKATGEEDDDGQTTTTTTKQQPTTGLGDVCPKANTANSAARSIPLRSAAGVDCMQQRYCR